MGDIWAIFWRYFGDILPRFCMAKIDGIFFKKKMAIDFNTIEDFFSQVDDLEERKFKLLHKEMNLKVAENSPVEKFLNLLSEKESKSFAKPSTDSKKRKTSSKRT